MEYLPTPVKHGADKYVGAVAQGYDAKRENSPKHTIEQKIIEDMLGGLADGSWILDAPCGTGRFFKFYQEHKHVVRALDLSHDMINQAGMKVEEENSQRFYFAQGDVRDTNLEDKCVDASVMCRLTRWLSPEGCVDAWRELQRVTRQKIIFTARVRNHPHARTYELIESALDGWKIARDETGVDLDYRIIELRPTT